MNEEVEEDSTPMDNDEASEGGPHLRKSEFPADGIAQMDVHWAIREECARKKFHCLWVECKRSYVSKQKLNKHLINYHYFVDIEGGGKGRRSRMADLTRTRATTAEENRRNNLRAVSNSIARLKRQDAKAKSRWTVVAAQQWDNMLRDVEENFLSEELPLLEWLLTGRSKVNLDLRSGTILF